MRIESEDINTSRSSIAFSLMAEGKELLQFYNLSISNNLTVAVVSSWSGENKKIHRAISDIEQGRKLFSQLRANWPELEKYFSGNNSVIELIEDYGMGSVLLGSSCKESEYTWHVNIAT